MKITEISLKKPVFAWMIMASFILFGALSFTRLGISENPDVDNPAVNVSVAWEGAAPEVVELDVVDQLESSLLSVEGIKKMTSESRRGRADITLEFDLSKDINVAVQETQSILGQAQRRLPEGIEAPVVTKSNPEDRPIMWLSVTSSTMSKKELMTFTRDHIRDRFQTIEGVAEVIMGGYVEPALRVWVKDDQLKRYAFSVTDIFNAINNEHAEYPAGLFETPSTEYNIRVLGEASSVAEFSKLSINQRGGAPNFSPIPLKQVADVEDGLDDQRRISRVMGEPSIGLGFRKQRGTNAVEVAREVKEKLRLLAPSLPAGLEMGVNYDGTLFIEESIDELKFTLVLAVIMTSLVTFLFLGSFGAALNIILSIPTAIIATFMALHFFGFTLNTFTMLGLTLAVGLVVDDNIMILENITRVYKNGETKVKAALNGTSQISFAALASSSSIVAIFLPLGFVSGIVGRYFLEFAVTLCAAIFFSYIDAVTLTPMRTSYLLRRQKTDKKSGMDRLMEKLSAFYSSALAWSLSRKKIIFLAGFLIFSSTIFIAASLNKEFTPAQDQSRLVMIMKTKPGSSLEYTEKKVAQIEKILMEQPELRRYLVAIGGFSGVESNSAFSYVSMLPKSDRPKNPELNKVLSQQEWAQYLRKKMSAIKGVRVIINDPSLGGFGQGRSYPIEFSLVGPNWEDLIELSASVQKRMEESNLMAEIDSNYKGMIPELRIAPDREKARARGVSIDEIGRTVQTMISGVVAGKFSKGGRRYDIKVKIRENQLNEVKDISQIMVRNNRGELIPLNEVTKIEKDQGLLSVTRTDRARAITITSNLAQGVSQGEALGYIREKIIPELPPGYSLFESGSTQTYDESFTSLIFVLLLGLVISFMILASQFNSFVHPLIIISALPFSFTGAFLALKLGGQSLNIYSMIGIILLMGIVLKNSIILVDLTNQLRQQGRQVKEALLEACPIRLKPIIMTSLSTIAGTLPVALSLGPGAETRVPMALAVIGGLTFSTLLTLFIVPALYMIMPGKIDLQRSQL